MTTDTALSPNGTVFEETAIEKPQRSPLGFTPRNLDEAWRLAEWLSKSGLMPKALQNRPNDTLVVLMKGMELGLKPMQAFGTIHVIDGKASCAAELMVGLVKAHAACEFFRLLESSAKTATFETKRRGQQPVRMSWTIEQAQKANLLGKDNWKKYPEAMLRARCVSALCKAEWADVTMGLVTPDEAEEIAVNEPPGGVEAPRGRVVESLPVSKVTQLKQRVAEKLQPAPTTQAPAREEPHVERAEAPLSPGADVPTAQEEVGQTKPSTLSGPHLVFGPAKGKPVESLTAEELQDSIDLAEGKLAKEPKAKWAKDVSACLGHLKEEQQRRLDALGAPEPGSEG